MTWVSIVAIVLEALLGSEGLVRRILSHFNVGGQAEPYLSLGFVGVKYCQAMLENAEDPAALKEFLTKSPHQIWAEAGDIETENAILRDLQINRVTERE